MNLASPYHNTPSPSLAPVPGVPPGRYGRHAQPRRLQARKSSWLKFWLPLILLAALITPVLVWMMPGLEDNGATEPSQNTQSASLVAPPPTWKPVLRPEPRYRVDLYGAAMGWDIAVRQHSATGIREDQLMLGTFEEEGPHIRLVLTEDHANLPRGGSLFIDLVRQAAENGLAVSRNLQASLLATKFGQFETATIELNGDKTRPCLAFRRQDSGFLRVSGWMCPAVAEKISPPMLACLIDRIALARPQSEPVLAPAFKAALDNPAPTACNASQPLAGPVKIPAAAPVTASASPTVSSAIPARTALRSALP